MYMSKITEYLGYVAFGAALTATLGSLYLSEILGWVPCELCWYQRVCMYPLVLIIGIGVMRRDKGWMPTAMALAGIGWVISLYHSLLQWGVISASLAPCTGGVSCAVKETEPWLGFITIPFMAFVAFSIILVTSVVLWRGVKNDKRI